MNSGLREQLVFEKNDAVFNQLEIVPIDVTSKILDYLSDSLEIGGRVYTNYRDYCSKNFGKSLDDILYDTVAFVSDAINLYPNVKEYLDNVSSDNILICTGADVMATTGHRQTSSNNFIPEAWIGENMVGSALALIRDVMRGD